MAEITTNETNGKKLQVKKRAKRHSTRIDMTPMVDLMSLLITFFMLTTAFNKPKIMEIVLPDKDTSGDYKAISQRTLNLLLSGNNEVFYYVGKPPLNDKDLEESTHRIQKTDYGKDGIRRTVLKMNMLLYEKVDSATQDVVNGKTKISNDSIINLIKTYKRKDKNGPIVLIKADTNAKYKNLVDVIDEMAICNVARYAIVDINEYEKKLIKNAPR